MRIPCLMLTAILLLAGDVFGGEPPSSRLYIRTIPPGAKVVLDGKELGMADGLFIILPGDHIVTLELEGYSPEKRDVKVPAERITPLVVTLVKRDEPADTHPAGTGKPSPQPPSAPLPPPPERVEPGLPALYTESRCGDMPVAMHDFLCSDVLNGMIYTFGGNRAGDRLVDGIFVYDVKKNTWREAAGRMPYPYCASGATMATAVWANKVYISPGLGPTRNNGWGQHY